MTHLYKAVVLITGACGGFGQELILQLLEAHCQLILTDINEAVLYERVEATKLMVLSGNVLACIAADLSTREGCESLYRQVKALDTPIDILVNNAGIALSGRMDEVPSNKWESLIQVNLIAPMRLSSLFAADMIARRQGHIVNISSVAGWSASGGMAHYAASKFGLRGFSEGLSEEVKKYNVQVSVVYPFFSRTPILKSEGYGTLAKAIQNFPEYLATEPAKVIHATIQGIIDNKLHIFPDPMAKIIHVLSCLNSLKF